VDFNFQSNNSFLSLYHIEFSDLDAASWQQANRILEQAEWAAEKAIEIIWDGLYKVCDAIPDPPAVGDIAKTLCRGPLNIAKTFVVTIYFAAHTVSFD